MGRWKPGDGRKPKPKADVPQRLPAEGGGIECRRCGCKHFETTKTERREKIIRRRRECRNCKLIVWTWEVAEGESVPAGFAKWFKFLGW